jgi:putative phosphoesterase
VLRIGLISDTHGLLRPQAEAFLRGSDHIVHAGDICDALVLDRLAALAPLTVVRGNNDHGAWAERLPLSARISWGEVHCLVIHDLAQLDVDPQAAGIQVVVSGHSHRPLVQHRGPVLYANPGSAGPRRFKLPVSAAELLVHNGTVEARITEFAV